MDANDYPVGYVKDGYVAVFVSVTQKEWKAVPADADLEKEDSIVNQHGPNIVRTNETVKILTEDMRKVSLEKSKDVKKRINLYHQFMREYMATSDSTVPYKIRFKQAVEEWHRYKASSCKQDITKT